MFVTGRSAGTSNTVGYATVAYNAATGDGLWAARYTRDDPANSWDAASSVVVSPGGRMVFVTGYRQGITSGMDYATVAYSAATGARLWVARDNGPGNGNDIAYSLAVSPSTGTVYVTGTSWGGRSSGEAYATIACHH